jgi:hypothetical protein
MIDFTLLNYKKLLIVLTQNKYSSIVFNEILSTKKGVFLRHDVDSLPLNSLRIAQMEHSHGFNGTYYFRIVSGSYDLKIMNKIAALGHKIGYHYEDVDLVSKECRVKNNELYNKYKNEYLEVLIDMAYESFCKNLEVFRRNFDIDTICMHGSPGSKYDNKIIWRKYSYKDLGIIGEPYFDINFNEFAYFTDTGRRWNGNKYNIRDKVNSKFNFDFKTTQDIIDNIDKLPYKLMFTIHPERWNDKPFPWIKEFVLQNINNFAKRGLLLLRKY